MEEGPAAGGILLQGPKRGTDAPGYRTSLAIWVHSYLPPDTGDCAPPNSDITDLLQEEHPKILTGIGEGY